MKKMPIVSIIFIVLSLWLFIIYFSKPFDRWSHHYFLLKRVLAEHCTITIELENHYNLNGEYPPWDYLGNRSKLTYYGIKVPNELQGLPTFSVDRKDIDISKEFPDHFYLGLYVDPYSPYVGTRKKGSGLPYLYYKANGLDSGKEFCVIWSCGSDRKYDLTLEMLKSVDTFTSTSAVYTNCAYDPTNGIESRGDIITINQR